MDKYVMDIRLQNWISIFEAQARSGLDKQTFCVSYDRTAGTRKPEYSANGSQKNHK